MNYKTIKSQLLIYGSALAFVSSVLLFFATKDQAYSYYDFLRIAVPLASIIVAVTAAVHNEPLVVLPAVFAMILFNPIVSFSFSKSTWQILDFAFAAFFLGVALAFPYEYYKKR